MLFKINRNACAYAATTMAAVLMNSVYQFYYVKLFLNNYKISSYWFNFAQIFYMIWNAINDPLFGYFQDYSKLECLKHRQLNILYGAPLYALSFLLPWFGWTNENSPDWLAGFHLLISLSFYDCMFTFVLLAQCSLFAEISRNKDERISLMMHSTIASILGSSAVFLVEIFSDHMQNIHGLQVTCVVIAIISWLLLTYSARNVQVDVDRSNHSKQQDSTNTSWGTAIQTSIEIFTNKNFTCFVLMNFCQVFHSTFAANFFSIFREHLIGPSALPSFVLSFMAGSAFLLPSVLVLVFNPLISKYGAYQLILFSFVAKILMALSLYVFGYQSVILIAIFMVLDSAFVGASFSLFNLSVSDIIDDDQLTHKRTHPVSSMVFGLNALVTKPAQSIAPMCIVYVLKQYGYKSADSSLQNDKQALQDVMFNIMVVLPIVVGILQLLIWRIYTLKNTSKNKEVDAILM